MVPVIIFTTYYCDYFERDRELSDHRAAESIRVS